MVSDPRDLCSFTVEIIETYWNVNGQAVRRLLSVFCEIIETYWNVNAVVSDVSVFLYTNNRNILECKYVVAVFTFWHTPEIIETYWNVNVLEFPFQCL